MLRLNRLYPNIVTILGLIMLWSLMAVSSGVAAEGGNRYFQTLQKKLIADGFDLHTIENLYRRPQVQFDARGISAFFTYRESRLNYGQFTSLRSIRKAKKYVKNHENDLLHAEKLYGVDRYVITAIILVETKLGTYLGDRSILNTLSTMASLSDPAVREMFWERIPKSRRITREKFEAKAKAKSQWAYRELKAFLRHVADEKIDPCSVIGSFAGAMGIAQFMPSNVLTFARDGNGDGRIDLFDHADAIASIANYLKHFGWRPGIERKKAYGILLHYNYSKYYVNTLLTIAEQLNPN